MLDKDNSKLVRNGKIQIGLNIVITIVLYYLSYLAYAHNYEITKTTLFGYETQMRYNKMQYLHIIAIANTIYTCYIIFKFKKAQKDTN